MKKLSKVAIPLLTLIAVAGCKSPSIVGTWQMAEGNISGINKLTVNFDEDGTATAKAVAGVGPLSVTGKAEGTYDVEGNNLTVTLQKADLDSFPEDLRDYIQAAIDSQAKRLSGPIRWKGSDSFEVGTSPDVYVFNRAKP